MNRNCCFENERANDEYMAKIVVDAMQLAESVSEINLNSITDNSNNNDPTNVINIFTKS